MKIPESILKKVKKPARYTGGEWGQTIKDKKDIDIRFAFCFPDPYEIVFTSAPAQLVDILLPVSARTCPRAPSRNGNAQIHSDLE